MMEVAIIIALCLNAFMSTVVVISVFPALSRMKSAGTVSGFIKGYGMFAVSLEVSVAILTLMTIVEGAQDIIIAGVQLPFLLLGMMALAGANISVWVSMFHSKRW